MRDLITSMARMYREAEIKRNRAAGSHSMSEHAHQVGVKEALEQVADLVGFDIKEESRR